MNRPVFILGCTKAGTTLMRNLFDGHPDFFVIPMESHFYQNIKYWVNYYTRRTKPEDLSYDQMKESLCRWVEHMNSYYDRVADNFTKGQWDINKFRQLIYSEEIDNIRDLSDLYVKAIYYSLHNSLFDESKDFIEKSVENAEFAIEWKKLYPEARFIHIVRNPYSNFVSFRKFVNKKKFPILKGVVYSMYNSYYYLFKNLRILDNYKVVIYEELVSEPDKIMKELANFLGVEFRESMLYPTLLGDSWAGNSTSDVQYTKVSSANINKWNKDITDFEIHIVNELFDQVLEKYKFKKLKPVKSKFYPAKKENLKTYLFNRALWRLMPKF